MIALAQLRKKGFFLLFLQLLILFFAFKNGGCKGRRIFINGKEFIYKKRRIYGKVIY